MEDPNITMEEYIRLEKEKARRRGKVYNWVTATYGRIRYADEVHNLRSVETKFSAIVFDDTFTSQVAISCEPTVSLLTTMKLTLEHLSENDNDKFNMNSFPSPEPTVSYFVVLDYFKDFEKEFPAIVYNDDLTSKSDFLTEPFINPQHIDEFNSKDETLLSKYDEEEQNILYFNDLFPLNLIYPNELKSDEDNDDKKIDIKQPWGDVSVLPLPDVINTDVGVYGMTKEMSMDIGARLSVRHIDADGVVVFTSHTWRRLFDIRGLLVRELMLEFFSTCRFDDLVLDLDTEGVLSFQLDGFRRYWAESSRTVVSKGDLRGYLEEILSFGDFLTTVPSYLLIRDPLRRLCHRLFTHTIAGRGQAPKKVTNTNLYFLRSIDQEAVNLPYLIAHYLFRYPKGRKPGAQMFDRHFIARLADHFGLLSEEKMHGLTMVVRDLTLIDLDELSRLHICEDLAGIPQPPPAARTMPQRLAMLEEEVHGIQVSLGEQREVVDTMAKDLSMFTVDVSGLELMTPAPQHHNSQTPDLPYHHF
ncbi:hypothetical protein Tco_1200438 [Tanacetum coccineum]